MLPDEATENATKFGFDDYSTLLASIIRDRNLQTPFTIAVHGDWGSGKTSLMKTVVKKLEFQDDKLKSVKAIWFSAWEFEKLQTPLWTVFLNRVIMDLQEMMPIELKEKIKDFGKGLLLLSTNLLLSKTTGVTTKDIEEIKDRVWNDIKAIDCLREELSHYIEEAIKSDPKRRTRIVVFIDDLDRCLPDQCVEIFESMKLFLNCKNSVFIVGVDKDQIRRTFEQRFGAREDKGLNYVGKFFQLEFDLPPKTPDEVKEFLLENASQQLQQSPKTIELISRFIEPNPRKIKRWLNSVIFLERLFKIKQEKLKIGLTEIDVSLASIWLFLKSFFPDFARKIEADTSILNAAIQVTNGRGSSEEKQKIGDFTIDKRLAEFLSLLKPTYNQKQLADMVYLSKLTPVLDVSTVPKDILKRVAEMSDEDLSAQLTLFGEEGASPLADRIIEKLDVHQFS
ncbi:MAG TPA: P-loop NTPase fold protein [Candidatus Bathyarchaeia archaeon]|nr:P-loop NTPase fold protein [Candidatus Bathyarchaeia archaeon]